MQNKRIFLSVLLLSSFVGFANASYNRDNHTMNIRNSVACEMFALGFTVLHVNQMFDLTENNATGVQFRLPSRSLEAGKLKQHYGSKGASKALPYLPQTFMKKAKRHSSSSKMGSRNSKDVDLDVAMRALTASNMHKSSK